MGRRCFQIECDDRIVAIPAKTQHHVRENQSHPGGERLERMQHQANRSENDQHHEHDSETHLQCTFARGKSIRPSVGVEMNCHLCRQLIPDPPVVPCRGGKRNPHQQNQLLVPVTSHASSATTRSSCARLSIPTRPTFRSTSGRMRCPCRSASRQPRFLLRSRHL